MLVYLTIYLHASIHVHKYFYSDGYSSEQWIFIEFVHFQVRLDYAMKEVLELLNLGRSRTNINPEVCVYVCPVLLSMPSFMYRYMIGVKLLIVEFGYI